MERVNAEILRAIAEGKKVQYRQFRSQLEWKSFDSADTISCWKLLAGSDNYEWRIAPKTIRIGEVEVPEPCREALKVGQKFWIADPFCGCSLHIWNCSEPCYRALNGGFVNLTKEAARQHYEAIKDLLKEK